MEGLSREVGVPEEGLEEEEEEEEAVAEVGKLLFSMTLTRLYLEPPMRTMMMPMPLTKLTGVAK